jgi:hypothetical protein
VVLPPRDRARDQVFELLFRNHPFVTFEDEALVHDFVAPGAVPGCFAVDAAGLVGHDFAGVGDGDGGGESQGGEASWDEVGETHFSVVCWVSAFSVGGSRDFGIVGAKGR